MKYSNSTEYQGLGKLERVRLSKLLRETSATISVKDASAILNLTSPQAAKLLSRYCNKGWLKRISRGVYIPVPLSSETSDVCPEEPFAIAEKLFTPCYIGGASAANYWDLTEQIFQTVTVMTEKLVSHRSLDIAENDFQIHTFKKEYFFGLNIIWLSGVKVRISDPTRTLVDMLMYPKFCGGVSFTEDVIKNYLASDYKDSELLISYLRRAKNGAAIKRLGFLLEYNSCDEAELIEFCQKNLTSGYIKLSPTQECPRLISRWRLWVSEDRKQNLK